MVAEVKAYKKCASTIALILSPKLQLQKGSGTPKWLRLYNSLVALHPEVLDVFPESLEGVLAHPLDLVVVQVEGLQPVDPAQGGAGERLNLIPGQAQGLQVS